MNTEYTNFRREDYPSDVHIVHDGDREFIIVGTAHISQQSANLVREVIENEQPDCVCVELDQQRHKALSEQKKWESLDLRTIIRQKQLSTLMVNLVLAAYQKRLGKQLGVTPGLELLEAVQAANENDIPIELCDRDVRVTLRRAWNSMSLRQKFQFMVAGLAGFFEKEEISEEKLEELRQKDVLSELMKELGEAMPVLKKVLIDERDQYLCEKMKQAPGKRIVSIVGAGHVAGMVEALEKHTTTDLEEIERIPPMSPAIKIIGWAIPMIIIGSIVIIGATQGAEAAGDNTLFWILANGIPASIGAMVALGHPLTVLAAFMGAPITSLTPVIGAGYVCAGVQIYVKPPVVKEFQTVSEDVLEAKMWWQNKLLRIFLVFLLSGLGSFLGNIVGGYEILTNLFK